jgi:hypothetical protein
MRHAVPGRRRGACPTESALPPLWHYTAAMAGPGHTGGPNPLAGKHSRLAGGGWLLGSVTRRAELEVFAVSGLVVILCASG